MKKIIILLLFFFCIYASFSQSNVIITIKDADTKESLQYCNVAIKNTNKGGMTNTDGKIQLKLFLEKDSLEISYLGYETKNISTKEINNTNIIFLSKANYLLGEVEVVANINFYNIVNKCRKRMLTYSNKKISKTYYSVESSTNNLPLEFLECYYNAEFNGIKLENLSFKNGRTALQKQSNYLLTYNTSKAVSMFDILYSNENYPTSILNYNNITMNKLFDINIEEVNASYFLINFSPKKNKNKFFSGNLWIDKNSFALLKISLIIDSTDTHPFEPRPFL
ncbi:MAG: carboxypeptidase-like regulatory domain-containing protein, partial [Bacteroidales bacterium]|nr:carboxypeptidase-like regulatory domain-containing protein [Bacteroidales bacterium]